MGFFVGEKKNVTLPPPKLTYIDLIVEAIVKLKSRQGSSGRELRDCIVSDHPNFKFEATKFNHALIYNSKHGGILLRSETSLFKLAMKK